METINDIVREMRTLGRLDEKSTDKIPRSLQGLGLRTYADRLEAAIKREIEDAIVATVKAAAESASKVYEPHIQSEPVGNAAAMREALEAINRIDTRGLKRLLYELVEADIFDGGQINKTISAVENARRALSDPARNCDVGSAEEQVDRFVGFCTSHKPFCIDCPLKGKGVCGILWSQMPFGKEKTK